MSFLSDKSDLYKKMKNGEISYADYQNQAFADFSFGHGDQGGNIVNTPAWVDNVANTVKDVLPDNIVENVEKNTLEWVKKNPDTAIDTLKNPSSQITKQLQTEATTDISKGIEEGLKPVWEKDTTKVILGEEGAKQLDPLTWVGLSDSEKQLVKKYWPVLAAVGGIIALKIALK